MAVNMLIGLTPENVFNLEEVSIIRACYMTEQYVFEFVLAMWSSMDSLMDREDILYEELAAELGDIIAGNDDEVVLDRTFAERYDLLYQVMKNLYERMKPYFGRIPWGWKNSPVQTITYQPVAFDTSLLRFHTDLDPL